MRRPFGPLLTTASRPAAQSPARPISGLVPVRLLVAGALLSLLLGAALLRSLASERAPVMPGAVTRTGTQLSRLPLAARGPISAALGAGAASYRVSVPRGGVAEAANESQGLTARFARSGVQVHSAGLTVALGLRAVGYGTTLSRVGAVAPTTTANRVLYAHSQVSEWYANGPLGLEQGFTLAHAPSGRAAGPLTLSIAVSGDARASLDSGGAGVVLARAHGPSLRYGALVATDAHDRTLRSWMEVAGGRILLRVDTRGASFPVRVDPLVQQGPKLTASDGQGIGLVGYSVAVSADGNTALVGGPGDNGFSGAAWVFTQTEGAWTQQGPKLTTGQPGGGGGEQCEEESEACSLGRSVALSADGNTALVGSPRETGTCPGAEVCLNQGAAWVFTRSESAWTRQAKLTGAPEETVGGRFGHSVALSGDGKTALIGAPNNEVGVGAVWVFTRSGENWSQQAPRLRAGGEMLGVGHLGSSVALSESGNTALVGASGDNGNRGAAWGFTRSGSTWTRQIPKLTGAQESGEAHLGLSVALSGDGTTALAGGRTDNSRAGAVWAFTLTGSTWSQQGPKLKPGEGGTPEGEFGYSVALSGHGDVALVGAPHDNASAGAAWELTRSAGVWTVRPEKLVGEAGKSWFGSGVALSSDAAVALVGAPHDSAKLGAVWPYRAVAPPPPPPAPTVTSITPTSGPTAGGTSVTIQGSGFLSGAKVTIGSEASSVNVVSETEITAKTAASAPGADEVVVSDERGTSTGGPLYTYVAPSTTRPNEPPEPPEVEEPFIEEPSGEAGVLASAASLLPRPTLGVTGNAVLLGGVVLVKLPGSATFVPLTRARQLPFGTIIDATHGKVSITTIGPHGRLQTVTFYEGMLRLTQGRNGVVLATLVGGDFSVCPTARERSHVARASARRASRKHTVRKLWAEGHGSYSTKGNYAAGAVLGTRWVTVDMCGGTLIRVTSDRVAVTNLVNHRRVTVKAGHSYFAKSP